MHIRGEFSLGWLAAATIMTLITVTCIIGNLVMLQAVRKAQRAPAHYALTSLLTADLLVGLCVLPPAAAAELLVFHPPWTFCACWSTLDVLCCTASILSLCTLGWERWWGITAPLALSHRCSRVKTLVNLLWPASVIIALPTGFIPSPRHVYEGETPKACTANINVGYVFASVSFSFYIPTSVMVFFYSMILKSLATSPTIRSHRGGSPYQNNAAKNGNNNVTSKEQPKCQEPSDDKIDQNTLCVTPKRTHLAIPRVLIPSPLRKPSPVKLGNTLSSIIPRQRRATQTIVMLMSLFLLCWTPFFVMLPIDSLCNCVRDFVWQWCTWLGYANSALNPLVYAAASPSVRRALPASLPLTISARCSCNDAPSSPHVRRA